MDRASQTAALSTLAMAGNTMLLMQIALNPPVVATLLGYAAFCAVAYPLLRTQTGRADRT